MNSCFEASQGVCFVEGKGAPLAPSPGAKKRLVMEEKRDEARAKLEGSIFHTDGFGRAFFNGVCVVDVAFFFEVVQPLTGCLGLLFWGWGWMINVRELGNALSHLRHISYSMLALGNLKLDNAAWVNMTF